MFLKSLSFKTFRYSFRPSSVEMFDEPWMLYWLAHDANTRIVRKAYIILFIDFIIHILVYRQS